MPHISPQDINLISDFESLLRFLHDKLGWQVEVPQYGERFDLV